jgi:hypothetical protein
MRQRLLVGKRGSSNLSLWYAQMELHSMQFYALCGFSFT